MRFVGRRIAQTNTAISVSPQEVKRLQKYRDRQAPGHWDDPAAAAVLELLTGVIGPPDEPDDPPPPSGSPTP